MKRLIFGSYWYGKLRTPKPSVDWYGNEWGDPALSHTKIYHFSGKIEVDDLDGSFTGTIEDEFGEAEVKGQRIWMPESPDFMKLEFFKTYLPGHAEGAAHYPIRYEYRNVESNGWFGVALPDPREEFEEGYKWQTICVLVPDTRDVLERRRERLQGKEA